MNPRIWIVGTSGSGKTTLAKAIAQRLSIPHVELDSLYHQPNWTAAPIEVFRDRVSQSLRGDTWVVDGNYSKVRDRVGRRANTLIWLDYPLSVIMSRLLRRTWGRVVTQEELWNGNRETWKTTLSKDSILLWALQTYQKNRREYSQLFAQPEYTHLNVLRMRSPQATQNWLGCIDSL